MTIFLYRNSQTCRIPEDTPFQKIAGYEKVYGWPSNRVHFVHFTNAVFSMLSEAHQVVAEVPLVAEFHLVEDYLTVAEHPASDHWLKYSCTDPELYQFDPYLFDVLEILPLFAEILLDPTVDCLC